jgi:hypothetical protein
MNKPLLTAFAAAFLLAAGAHATTPSYNFGSLGSAADGVNATAVALGLGSPLLDPTDLAVGYSAGSNTLVSFNPVLNPLSNTPFTIEFWAMPSGSDNDDAPVSNRLATGNRSGWVFFQRAAATGWNFRMYNGNGNEVGLQLTGGTATVGVWNHVVATWDGTTPKLFVNGADTSAPLVVGGLGGYVANSAGIDFSVGANANGSSPYEGRVDETAFYTTALSAGQIASHYAAASNTTPGFYRTAVQNDGAVLHLTNIPEPTSAVLMVGGLAILAARRRRA